MGLKLSRQSSDVELVDGGYEVVDLLFSLVPVRLKFACGAIS